MDEEIVYADKSLRQWIVFLAIILTAVGCWVFELSHNYFRDLETLMGNNLKEGVSKVVLFVYAWAAFFAAGILVAFSYFLRLGIRIIKASQFPPPSMRVVRDTKIVRGTKAKLRGRVAVGLVLAILIWGFTVVVVGSKLMSDLAEKALEKGEVYNTSLQRRAEASISSTF